MTPGRSVVPRGGRPVLAQLRLRFEADKRVPGAPASGMAWAETSPPRGPVASACSSPCWWGGRALRG
jgi:hypothetical protein